LSFRLIPAIDLLDGQVVRLHQGDYAQAKRYARDPVELVHEFAGAGATLIHLVDLNAARTGSRLENAAAVAAVAQAVPPGVQLEVGGGVRDAEAIRDYLSMGMARVIVGTAAVRSPELLGQAIALHGQDRVVVGVDARKGTIRVSGWEEDSGMDLKEFLRRLGDSGVREIIYTDIVRDGAETGPALGAGLTRILAETDFRVILSGGVGSLDDVLAVQAAAKTEPRLVGLIAGRAIYEGRLDVRQAIVTLAAS